MTAGTKKRDRLALRMVAEAPPATAYFESILLTYDITNVSTDNILVESVSLQFQPDMDTVPNYVYSPCGFRLTPNESKSIAVDVTPTPAYRQQTNEIQFLFRYRIESSGHVGDVIKERHDQERYYLIVRPPAPTLGEVFVSFKQPEDQRLANILERYLRRAGFVPRLFMRNAKVGADQWVSIEEIVKVCQSAFIVWTHLTEWGNGVEREIELCRGCKVREILVIENGVDVPSSYYGTGITYKRFDPQEPAQALSEAVASLREQVVKSATPDVE